VRACDVLYSGKNCGAGRQTFETHQELVAYHGTGVLGALYQIRALGDIDLRIEDIS
jgi:hypothetical protein